MRMWCVPTAGMCRQHLLGEHNELHMLVGSINRGKNLGKLLDGCVDTTRIKARHEEIVAEMLQRGYKHTSVLPDFVDPHLGRVQEDSHALLISRCKECK